jgi:hypothetical protein
MCPGSCRRRLGPGCPSWRSAPEADAPARLERCRRGTGEVADDEVVIVRSTQLAGQSVVREPQFRPRLTRVLCDGSRGSEPGREQRPSYGPTESLRTGWFGRGTPILPAVVASPTPGVVASAHPLVEVGSSVAVVVLVAEATRGRRRCVALAPGVDRGFSHESRSRGTMLRGYPCPREAELSARRTAASSRRFLSSPWISRPSVVDGSGIARSSIVAAARFWPTPLETGGSLGLGSLVTRCWTSWGRWRASPARARPAHSCPKFSRGCASVPASSSSLACISRICLSCAS